MHDLIFIPTVRDLEKITTAVLYARQAQTYLKISSDGFSKSMRNGVIKRFMYVAGKRPFFLKHDLDAYLAIQLRYKIHSGESSSNSVERSSG
jgi:hypothetical protein